MKPGADNKSEQYATYHIVQNGTTADGKEKRCPATKNDVSYRYIEQQ